MDGPGDVAALPDAPDFSRAIGYAVRERISTWHLACRKAVGAEARAGRRRRSSLITAKKKEYVAWLA